MIKNKTLAIILAVLTFIVGSVILMFAALYVLKIPISAIWEAQNQYILFSAILVSAILASMVYGRGTKQRAQGSTEFLNERLELQISENTVRKLLKLLENFPPYVVNMYVSKKINAVDEFKDEIKQQISKLNDEDILKVKKIIEMPTTELQGILNELYSITNMEQLQILSKPEAAHLIEVNLNELKKIISNNYL